MAVNNVGNIAPFINDVFTITSHWWYERVNPVTGEVQIHRGLDIATSGSKPVYSMLNGIIHSKGTDSSQGNWVVIYDNNPSSPFYGYATRYMHLAQSVLYPVGTSVRAGQFVAMEGTTGQSTGIHLHVEMQDLNRWGGQWHWSYTKTDYLDPTAFMGIENVDNTQWIYDGTPYNPSIINKRRYNFVLFNRRRRFNQYEKR